MVAAVEGGGNGAVGQCQSSLAMPSAQIPTAPCTAAAAHARRRAMAKRHLTPKNGTTVATKDCATAANRQDELATHIIVEAASARRLSAASRGRNTDAESRVHPNSRTSPPHAAAAVLPPMQAKRTATR